MEQEMTFGDKLVGRDFNPSNNTKVDRVKEICAELANIAMDKLVEVNNSSASVLKYNIHNLLYNKAVGEILNAQMNVVKLLTFKP